MTRAPDRVIMVYDGESGVRAMLLDVVKRVVGREDCALCEITYGPLGKRQAWTACEKRLGVAFEEMHRDRLPAEWSLTPADIPCILARVGDEVPTVLVTRTEIIACRGRIDALERRMRETLEPLHATAAADGAPRPR